MIQLDFKGRTAVVTGGAMGIGWGAAGFSKPPYDCVKQIGDRRVTPLGDLNKQDSSEWIVSRETLFYRPRG
jgi:hypothetical protein